MALVVVVIVVLLVVVVVGVGEASGVVVYCMWYVIVG